jgi:hypothetical protein
MRPPNEYVLVVEVVSVESSDEKDILHITIILDSWNPSPYSPDSYYHNTLFSREFNYERVVQLKRRIWKRKSFVTASQL